MQRIFSKSCIKAQKMVFSHQRAQTSGYCAVQVYRYMASSNISSAPTASDVSHAGCMHTVMMIARDITKQQHLLTSDVTWWHCGHAGASCFERRHGVCRAPGRCARLLSQHARGPPIEEQRTRPAPYMARSFSRLLYPWRGGSLIRIS